MEYYNTTSKINTSTYKKAAVAAGAVLIGATTAAYIKGKSIAPQDTFVKQTAKGYQSAWNKTKTFFAKSFAKDKTPQSTNRTITQTTTTTNQISFIQNNGKTEVTVNGQKITDKKEIKKYMKMNQALNTLGEAVSDVSSTIGQNGGQTKIVVNGKVITDEKEIEKYTKIINDTMKKAGFAK